MSKEKKRPSAFMKPMHVSPELAKIVGNGPMPRTEVMKKLWEYIKKHKLQDPKNKRNIIPDTSLGQVLGNSPINMFKMTGKVFGHLRDTETAGSRQ